MNPFLRTSLLLCLTLMAGAFSARAQDPDIAADEASRLEEVFRSSEQPGETPVGRRQREKLHKRVSVPPGAFRIACRCMDDTHSDTRSSGACSGHGGVRYWVYRTKEGDTVHVLTARHERHPQALNAAEMSEISQKTENRVRQLKQNALAPYLPQQPVVVVPEAHEGLHWPEAVGLAVAGVALYFIVKMLLFWLRDNEQLVRYALRHLLRYNKRPPARARRKRPRTKRLP